ncbi:hypothetical protein YUBABA_00860 [Serratia phage vB_SmaM-Yubaba]|nr:hypothetical protein YUBABA_00860 [Serratia phage vB_SmaM-Yubaba]
MKSIIGYYYEPLSQVEREMMYNHFQKEWDTNFTEMLASRIIRAMHEAQRDPIWLNGRVDAYLEAMNQHMVKCLTQLSEEFPGLPELKNESVTFFLNGEELKVELTPWLESVYKQETVIKSQRDHYRDNVGGLIYEYNTYLFRNPTAREVSPSTLGQSVERANQAILDKMENHCYEPQTSNQVFDFSPILLKLIKETK